MAHIGIGVGKGELQSVEAAKNAVASPLLETKIDGARAADQHLRQRGHGHC